MLPTVAGDVKSCMLNEPAGTVARFTVIPVVMSKIGTTAGAVTKLNLAIVIPGGVGVG